MAKCQVFFVFINSVDEYKKLEVLPYFCQSPHTRHLPIVLIEYTCNWTWEASQLTTRPSVNSIAVSVFVVILVDFDKYYQKQKQIPTDGETSRFVWPGDTVQSKQLDGSAVTWTRFGGSLYFL